MVQIYINGKFLTQRLTGVQRYALEVTKALIAEGTDLRIVVPTYLATENFDFPNEVFVKVGKTRNTILWEQLILPFFLWRKKKYLLINLCNIGPLLLKKQLICIHDVAFLVNPSWFSSFFSRYYRFMLPKLAKRSLHVLTVSEFSKQEICRYFGLLSSAVSVLYNAPAKLFTLTSQQDIVLEKDDFFLAVGSLDPRKNLNLLLQLFALEKYKNQKLVIVGAKFKGFNEIEAAVPANVVIKETCSDKELAWLYRHAKALLNASFYEGFGLPLVEAMASGCPLILSDIPAFREIAGDRALYFDPHSIESLVKVLEFFFTEAEASKNEVLVKNYRHSLTFNWSKTAQNLNRVIATIEVGTSVL